MKKHCLILFFNLFNMSNNLLIYIIRHGRTEKNFKKATCTESINDTNSKLDHIGRLQAILVGQFFYNNESARKLVGIYTSPRLRTLQTAELIMTYAGKDIDISTKDVLKKKFSSKEYTPESLKERKDELRNLLLNIYEKYKDTNGCVALITHNHIINLLHAMYTNSSDKFKVDNCCINCLKISNGNIEPVFWDKKIKQEFVLV